MSPTLMGKKVNGLPLLLRLREFYLTAHTSIVRANQMMKPHSVKSDSMYSVCGNASAK